MQSTSVPGPALAFLLGGSLGAFGFVLFLVTFLLGLGWATRNRAVLCLALLLAMVPGPAAAVWVLSEAFRTQAGVYRSAFFACLQLLGFLWTVLVGATVYRLRKLPVPPRRIRVEYLAPKYDRDWMLSLLQRHAGSTEERVAIPSADVNVAEPGPQGDPSS